jgi:hypothetical protein
MLHHYEDTALLEAPRGEDAARGDKQVGVQEPQDRPVPVLADRLATLRPGLGTSIPTCWR